MKWFIASWFILIVNFAHSQTICYDVDSVVVYSVPLDINPKFSLQVEDIKNKYCKKIIIKDSILVNELLETLLIIEVFKRDDFSIDLRMIIEIHFQDIYTSINIDRNYFFVYNNILYTRNFKLIDWIDKYVTSAH